jgi:hypothetical protein
VSKKESKRRMTVKAEPVGNIGHGLSKHMTNNNQSPIRIGISSMNSDKIGD